MNGRRFGSGLHQFGSNATVPALITSALSNPRSENRPSPQQHVAGAGVYCSTERIEPSRPALLGGGPVCAPLRRRHPPLSSVPGMPRTSAHRESSGSTGSVRSQSWAPRAWREWPRCRGHSKSAALQPASPLAGHWAQPTATPCTTRNTQVPCSTADEHRRASREGTSTLAGTRGCGDNNTSCVLGAVVSHAYRSRRWINTRWVRGTWQPRRRQHQQTQPKPSHPPVEGDRPLLCSRDSENTPDAGPPMESPEPKRRLRKRSSNRHCPRPAMPRRHTP